ncbi:MAG: hypothetical protein AB7F43_10980 [Bacteriovoracia bacterium]
MFFSKQLLLLLAAVNLVSAVSKADDRIPQISVFAQALDNLSPDERKIDGKWVSRSSWNRPDGIVLEELTKARAILSDISTRGLKRKFGEIDTFHTVSSGSVIYIPTEQIDSEGRSTGALVHIPEKLRNTKDEKAIFEQIQLALHEMDRTISEKTVSGVELAIKDSISHRSNIRASARWIRQFTIEYPAVPITATVLAVIATLYWKYYKDEPNKDPESSNK